MEKTYEGVYGFVKMENGGMCPVEVIDVHNGIALVKNVAGFNQFEVSRDCLYLCEHFPGQIAQLIKALAKQEVPNVTA